MANDLHSLKIKKIDLVGLAANRRFTTLLKSHQPEATDTMSFDISKLPDEMQDFVKSMQGLAELRKLDTSTLEGEAKEFVDGLKKEAGLLDAPPAEDDKNKNATPQEPTITKEVILKALTDQSDEHEDVWKDVPSVVRETMESLKKAADESLEKVKKAEATLQKMAEQSEREKYIRKAADLKNLPNAKADDFGSVLHKASSALDGTEMDRLMTVLKAADKTIAESDLFREIGGRQVEEGSAEDEVNKAAAKLMEKDPKLTQEQAIADVYKANGELYERYEAERQARVARHRNGGI